MKQLSFLPKAKTEFGGSLLKGRRKTKRPLDSKLPIHLVLKAIQANILLRKKCEVRELLMKYAKQFGIRVYDFGVHADHIHIALKIPNRKLYVRWIRSFTGVLGRRIPGLKWRLRPYTRIASWGREFKKLIAYIRTNKIERENLLAIWEIIEEKDRHLRRQLALQT